MNYKGEEIKKLIQEKNDEIHSLLNPNIFTLNNQVRDLMEEIADLQNHCPHNFIDGYCDCFFWNLSWSDCNPNEENRKNQQCGCGRR